jgi:hypothetical protein
MSGNPQRPQMTFELKAGARLSLKPAADRAPATPAAGETQAAGAPPASGRLSQKELILRVLEAVKAL